MFNELAPIAILLAVVTFVIARLPKIELGHTQDFRRRRVMNWLPLGLTYAFLYMGRYNIKVSQHAFGEMKNTLGEPMMSNADFSTIFMWGTITYGASFLLNGPLTDRYGGKLAIMIGAGGSALCNLLMGLATWSLTAKADSAPWVMDNFLLLFSVLYAVNMYFQSFGAVAIVKVNAPWFHVRERGVFGAIFGILISLGVYFAFDWGYFIMKNFSLEMVFLVPTILLAIFWVIDVMVVKNSPGEAGHADFDTADASSGDEGPQLPALDVFKLMFKNPVIMTIACIEFCSGFLRQAIMQWFRTFAKQTDAILELKDSFVYENWGLLLCCAGIMGGVVAGLISDHVFQSRRGPVAGILYGGMLLGATIMTFTYNTAFVGPLVILMSMCVIGVHGMLSGTASMDFGGKKNVGIAVGIIDGFVYSGTAFMAGLYMVILPKDQLDTAGNLIGPATEPGNWISWPISMIPVSLIGLVLALKVWNAKPKPKTASTS
ncbi:MAG: MFS transporter [Myxococcota bacterium]|jgi:OPA family glycerol-3-phosphate transporter-like MFS transporter|nr:MFS transporter [Myxococcota bacterium]